MNARIENCLINLGCVLVMLSLPLAIYLAIEHAWWWALLPMLLGWAHCHGCNLKQNRETAWLKGELERVCIKAGLPAPKLEVGWAYSYPNFELTFPDFRSKLKAQEAGWLAEFEAIVQTKYGMLGPKDQPVEAQRAVHVKVTGC